MEKKKKERKKIEGVTNGDDMVVGKDAYSIHFGFFLNLIGIFVNFIQSITQFIGSRLFWVSK